MNATRFSRPFFKTAPASKSKLSTSTWRRRLPRLVLVSLLAMAICGFLDHRSSPREVRPLDPFEQVAQAVRLDIYGAYHGDKSRAAREKIVIVTINDNTFSRLVGPPVPRRFHGQLVRDLSKAGARAIAFDLLFKFPANEARDDRELESAARAHDNVIWACLFNEDAAPQARSNANDVNADDVVEMSGAPVRAIAAFRSASPREGHINSGALVLANPLVDRINPVLRENGRLMPAFALATARLATSNESAPLQRVSGGWQSGSLFVPTNAQGEMPITFLRPSDGGEDVSTDSVFPIIPYERLINGGANDRFFRDSDFWRDKIVLIGDSTKVGNDHRPTPVGEMPGVEIHAHAVATMLAGATIQPAPNWANLMAIVLLSASICVLSSARRFGRIVWGVGALGVAFLIFNVWLFAAYGIWLHLVAPLFALALATMGMLVEGGLFQEREREKMFDAFVTASASAIESRDPATSGHSHRVTQLCLGLAEAVSQVQSGPFKRTRFSGEQLKQLRYAGLLHDFGKIGVRESVLTKSHKLHPRHFEAVQCRLAATRSFLMLQSAQRHLQVLADGQGDASSADVSSAIAQIESETAAQIAQLDRDAAFLNQCNDPMVTFLPDAEYGQLREVLERLSRMSFIDAQNQKQAVINDEEKAALEIRKGSLTGEEYREIQNHAQLSYDFLKQIPWTDALASIPEIAWSHHEKLDGKGYPRGLKNEQISLPARIMTIADIFDALTAADRPYKKAMPIERALKILKEEAANGALDADLLRIFIEQRVYEKAVSAPPQVLADAPDVPLIAVANR